LVLVVPEHVRLMWRAVARLPGHSRIGVIVLVMMTAMAMPTLPSAASTRPEPTGEATGVPQTEGIPTYDVVLTIRKDGVLHVRETITYDFGDSPGPGIVRAVPYRIKNRLYEIGGVRASSSTGASAKVRTSKFLHELQISIGEEARPVSGLQAYVLDYDVIGALTVHGNRDELAWDALGTGWGVPIGDAAVRVVAPAPLAGADCEAGRPGETGRCGAGQGRRRSIEFTQSGLQPHEGMMIRIALPEGTVRVPPPRYAPAHLGCSWVGSGALVVVLLLAAVVWLRRRALAGRGRIRLVGTFLLAVGVVAVVWDMADDVLRGGLWAASIGDAAMIGMAAAFMGVTVIWAARPSVALVLE
jgi:hypothetical protein